LSWNQLHSLTLKKANKRRKVVRTPGYDNHPVDWVSGVKHMSKEPSAAQKMIADIAPKLAELTDSVLFGDVWERPELSKRDRSLATVAALVALNRPDQLRFHLNFAVQNGVKKEELVELITHLAFYSGWPNAMSAIMVAKEVLSKG
jgi:4-carboxymuconolactone decarboxylase